MPWFWSCRMAFAWAPVLRPRLEVSSRNLAPFCTSHWARARPNLKATTSAACGVVSVCDQRTSCCCGFAKNPDIIPENDISCLLVSDIHRCICPCALNTFVAKQSVFLRQIQCHTSLEPKEIRERGSPSQSSCDDITPVLPAKAVHSYI